MTQITIVNREIINTCNELINKKNIEKSAMAYVISEITKKGYNFELKTASADGVNGYGWHVRYYVSIYETIEYCSKCRIKTGKDISDDAHIHNNHKYFTETKMIYNGVYIEESAMIADLLVNFTKTQETIKRLNHDPHPPSLHG